MVVKEAILSPETLDAIYRTWLVNDNNNSYNNTSFLRYKTYQRQYRHGYNESRFEEWLYEQGFTIFQKDKQRYLKFIGDEKKLTLFLLKYGS